MRFDLEQNGEDRASSTGSIPGPLPKAQPPGWGNPRASPCRLLWGHWWDGAKQVCPYLPPSWGCRWGWDVEGKGSAELEWAHGAPGLAAGPWASPLAQGGAGQRWQVPGCASWLGSRLLAAPGLSAPVLCWALAVLRLPCKTLWC